MYRFTAHDLINSRATIAHATATGWRPAYVYGGTTDVGGECDHSRWDPGHGCPDCDTTARDFLLSATVWSEGRN